MGLLQRMISYFQIKVGNKLVLLKDRASRYIAGRAGCQVCINLPSGPGDERFCRLPAGGSYK